MPPSDDDFSDLDVLMSLDPLELSKQDLARIIAYQRKQRVLREQGVRTRKPKAQPAVSIEQLLNSMAAPAPQTNIAPGSKSFRRF